MTPEQLDQKIAELETKLPAHFAIKCSRSGDLIKTSRKTFLNRVRSLNGDVEFLMNNFVCKKERKDQNVDFVGRPKTKSSSVKVIGIEDLE